MAAKEATARIRINQLLAQAGWRFFAENGKPANIALEANVTLVRSEIDDLGNDFESVGKGYIDFLLLDDRGKPLVVLEAKSETKHPLDGKEQARAYAKGKAQCRFVLLSNGLSHYFWDLEQGNPYQITAFPSPQSLQDRFKQRAPDSQRLVDAIVKPDYIALSQLPHYLLDPDYLDQDTRSAYLLKNKLRFLRPYQQQAIHALQRAVNEGQDRFLFEMATGTGKTLTTAAVIKLFLSTSNAHRVLFLVDRLELEDQALKAFSEVLKNDYRTVIYKQNRDDWRDADIVVTTVQSLLKYNKYQRLFSPTDFDCVISDEAHRSIGGNARAVFDYFVGYKLGLTATPRDYLKNTAKTSLPIEALETERRVLLDTYRTFGCFDSQPTFRYTLLDGVREGYLINPTIVDARTSVTTQLMASGGFVVHATDENGISSEESFGLRAFEKRFFSEDTNRVLCQTIVQHGLRDSISGEFGKTLVFAVSQRHAAKLTQLLNEQAAIAFPNQYRSDFAVQVTSNVTDAQQFTGQFSDNKLLGNSLRLAEYKTSRARVCVTVGMMTTGYDCADLLNLALCRPIFSPTEFVQIKGRGTRKHDFTNELRGEALKQSFSGKNTAKTTYKLFDFFANCEYFENEFNYDEIIALPAGKGAGESEGGGDPPPPPPVSEGYIHSEQDSLTHFVASAVGEHGMKVDRMLYASFEAAVKQNTFLETLVKADDMGQAVHYVTTELFDKPNDYLNLDKLRRGIDTDRRVDLPEILQVIFGIQPRHKTADEVLFDEAGKYLQIHQISEPQVARAVGNYFKAYCTNAAMRHILDSKRFAELSTNAAFNSQDLLALPPLDRERLSNYIKDYVPLNQFLK